MRKDPYQLQLAFPVHTLRKHWVSHIKPNSHPMHFYSDSNDSERSSLHNLDHRLPFPSAVIRMPSPPCSPMPKHKPAVLFLFGELRLHDPLLRHIFYFFYQTTTFIQSLDVISTTNTATNDKYIWDSSPPCAFLQCSLQPRAELMGI